VTPHTSGGPGAAGGVDAAAAATKNIGLRGVTVADTKVSHVDGAAGRLIYRGYDIDVLAESSTYEEVAYLLIRGELPAAAELAGFCGQLGAARVLAPQTVAVLRAFDRDAKTMDVLQSLVPELAGHDVASSDASKEAMYVRAVDLVGKMASVTAAWHRLREGAEPVAADPAAGHAADFLRMVFGAAPTPAVARIMDVALILHADHSLNASTFVARTIESTRATIYAAIAGALGALSGELHGGANARVMEMLQTVGSLDRVEAYVRETLGGGGLIMGMGHAVYHTDDPRAVILRDLSRQMGVQAGEPLWYEITRRLQEVTQRVFRERKHADIYPNVDMYSASLYHSMGFPGDLFTPIFAVARVAGWSAHVIEERFAEAQDKPALYRPLADYVGQYCGPESCEYVPLERRE
jgi:citrate synthase